MSDATPRAGLLARADAIGRYTVLTLVGSGGMGDVYAAYDPQLDRKVAIKLLRVRAQGPEDEGQRRLMREAQAIAKLSHPNVVVVYDAGTFQDQVFVAMEFVDGHTLRYWTQAQARPWPEVLKVFGDAGRGLAAAHDKGIIHRDFKPDNVMIGADGHVRVMDFGLARMVGIGDQPVAAAPGAGGPSDAAQPSPVIGATELRAALAWANDLDSTRRLESTRAGGSSQRRSGTSGEAFSLQLTQVGDMVGTPGYMSPEQFAVGDVDASTDQFSFCVALYEALYGQRPFAGTSPLELAANVMQGRVREAPSGTPVPGWLRKIVLRGLRVDRSERWPSMHALVTALDRNRALARRRRFATAAAAKLAGVWEPPVRGRPVVTAVKTEAQEAFLSTGKRYAATAFEKASQILDAYAQSWSATYVDACEATHVRGEQSAEVLDLRMASLQEGLDGLKALVQVFRQANAEVVENAVTAAGALGNVERGADVKLLRQVVRPPEDPAVRAEVARLRARLAEVRVFCSVGRLGDGLREIVPLEEQARRTGYGPVIAEALFEWGNLLIERRDTAAASRALEEAVWTAELSRHDEVSAMAATQLVYVVGDAQLRFDAGEIWARYAETILTRMGGHDALWGWLFNNRGAMRESQGRLAEALDDARHAVEVKIRALGPQNPDVAGSTGNIALLLDQLGDHQGAIEHAQRAAQIAESGLGPHHPRTAILLSNCGEVLNRVGRFAEARAMAERALGIFEGETDPSGVIVTYPLTVLGIGYLGDGLAEQACPILERAVEIRERLGPRPANRGEVHFALASALALLGRDPSRAHRLATLARDEYTQAAPSPAIRTQLDQIDAWLAAHPLSSRG
ncbi:MAG TPA: serine/threonine-protein kinase [Polyangia bacterium]